MEDTRKDELAQAMKKWGILHERERILSILEKYCLPKQYQKIKTEIEKQ
jgi:hypothetical protein